MRLCVFVEPQQGATYTDQLQVAQRSEQCGFDGFFRSDHFLAMGRDGLPGPTDAWLTLAALARETSRIRLGSLLSSATFRLPALLAVSVAQVDQMSGGRVELGLGAGWYEAEHRAYGVPFPPVALRFDRLAEQLAIITGMWSAAAKGERFDFHGTHYDLADSPALPAPVQVPGPPVIVGGWGPRRTPELAARFADEFNGAFRSVAETAGQYRRVRRACAAAGRDPVGGRPLAFSAAQVVCCGRTEAQARARAQAIGRPLEKLRTDGLAGSPAEIVDKLGRFAEAGASRVFLQILDMSDLEHLDLIAGEILPQVAGLRPGIG